MKKWLALVVVLCVALITMSFKGSYKKLWKEYEVSTDESLPRKSMDILSSIMNKAEKDKEVGHYFKAYVLYNNLETSLGELTTKGSIEKLEKWLQQDISKENQAILSTLLLNEYVQFYSQNRYRRGALTDVVSNDSVLNNIDLWSDVQYRDKFKYLYYRIFKDSHLLQAKSSKDYTPFIETGSFGKYFKHDLYHVLFWHTLPLLDQIPLSLELEEVSSKRLLDNSLTLYKDNKDATLLLQLEEIRRINIQNIYLNDNQASSEQKLKKLDEFILDNNQNELVVEAVNDKATLLLSGDKPAYVEVKKMCDEYIGKYPSYKRIELLKAHIQTIEHPSLVVNTLKRVHTKDNLIKSLEYRNLKNFQIDVFRVDGVLTDLRERDLNEEYLQANGVLKQSLKRDNLYREDYALQSEKDVSLAIDEQGYYILKLNAEGMQKPFYKSVLVSDVELIIQYPYIEGKHLEIASVDALTGHPVPGVVIDFHDQLDSDKKVGQQVTNEAGRIEWNQSEYTNLMLRAFYKGVMIQELRSIHPSGKNVEKFEANKKTMTLFTDRAIYRPGQKVYVKGYVYQATDLGYQAMNQYKDTIQIYDPSGAKLWEQEIETNSYGTFSLEMSLPKQLLTGNFYISPSKELTHNHTSFQVEEYKRPTFTIDFDQIEGAYKIGDKLVVKGTVDSFSGSLLKGTKIEVKVISYDHSFNIRRIPFIFLPQKNEKVLQENQLELAEGGGFTLEINTDQIIQRSIEVQITVTSLSGETHSETKNIWIDENPYRLSTNSNNRVVEKSNPLELFVKATNSDNVVVEAKGVVEISRKVSQNQGDDKDYQLVREFPFTANEELKVNISDLETGEYRMRYKGDGLKEYNTDEYLLVYSDKDSKVPVISGSWMHVINGSFDENTPAEFLFGTADADAFVYINYYANDGKVIAREKVFNKEYQKYSIPYKKEYGDGIYVVMFYLKEYELHTESIVINKKKEESQLNMMWVSFREKMQPGSEESWILKISNKDGKPIDSEVLALMYDASLDELSNNYSRFDLLKYNITNLPSVYVWIQSVYHQGLFGSFASDYKDVPPLAYDCFFADLTRNNYRINSQIRIRGMSAKGGRPLAQNNYVGEVMMAKNEQVSEVQLETSADAISAVPAPKVSDLRSNFSELAFFYPHLETNKKGEVSIKFTSPEQLTKWKFKALAHQKDMSTATIENSIHTEKKFAIQPNMPRYIRQGDQVVLTSVLKNEETKNLNTVVELTLYSSTDYKEIYSAQQEVEVAANSEVKVNFQLPLLSELGDVNVRIVASTDEVGDGEEHIIPVLSSKEPLIESKSVVVIAEGTTSHDLSFLFNGQSQSATNKSLTVEFSTNPMWFAVMPMLQAWNNTSDSPITYSNQLMSSILANQLITLNPAVFSDQRINEELVDRINNKEVHQNVQTAETPWLRLKMDTQELLAGLRVNATEFTSPVMLKTLLTKMSAFQQVDGGWSWYKGMNSQWYISLQMAQTLQYLQNSTLLDESSKAHVEKLLTSSIHYLYDYLSEYYELKKESSISEVQLSIIALSMDVKNFDFTKKEDAYKEEVLARLSEALKQGSLATKSIALQIAVSKNDRVVADKFYNSIKQHLLMDESGAHFGGPMYDNLYRTQQVATHIQVMKSLYVWNPDEDLLNQMKLWLATKLKDQRYMNEFVLNDALYVLANLGKVDYNDNSRTTIQIGNSRLELTKDMPYVYTTFNVDNKAIDKMTIQKEGSQVICGGIYAMFDEEVGQVKSYGEDVKVNTEYYVEKVQGDKRVLVLLEDGDKLNIGNVVVSRINFTLERDLDLVHIKDSRSASLEPIDTTSGYRWGLLFFRPNYLPSYVSVRDASTQYFYNYLRKGTYVLENRSYVSREGTYQSGIVTIQSMYAPELTGHSSSRVLEVE